MAKKSTRSDLLINPNLIEQRTEEDLQSEYLYTQQQLQKMQEEKEDIEQEFQQIFFALQAKNKQSVAIANTIGENSQITPSHIAILEHIEILEERVRKLQDLVDEARHHSSYTVIARLEKQFKDLFVEVEKIRFDIIAADEKEKRDYKKYLLDLTSDKYFNAFTSNMQIQALALHVQNYHQQTREVFKGATYQLKKKEEKEKRFIDKEEQDKIRTVLNIKIRREQQLEDVKARAECCKTQRDTYLATLLDEISRLNYELPEDKKINIKEIADKYFPDHSPKNPKDIKDEDFQLMQMKFGDVEPKMKLLQLLSDEDPPDPDAEDEDEYGNKRGKRNQPNHHLGFDEMYHELNTL